MSGCPLEGIKGANYPLTKRLYKKHSIGTVGIHVCDCVRICILYIYMQIRLSVFGVNAIFWSHCPVLESLEFSHFFLMFHECLYTISYGRLLVSHGCFTRTCFFSGCRSQT